MHRYQVAFEDESDGVGLLMVSELSDYVFNSRCFLSHHTVHHISWAHAGISLGGPIGNHCRDGRPSLVIIEVKSQATCLRVAAQPHLRR